MKKKTIKSHLLIGNKFLGSLLYFKDKDDRGCIKLSFKNKITNLVRWSDIPTTKLTPLPLQSPISLDVSYKFKDNLLEIKKVIDGKVVPEFHKIPVPFLTPLFIVRIKDWHILDNARDSKFSLVLDPGGHNNSIAIIFSFLGVEGKPIAPEKYNITMGLMGMIDLPEIEFNKFCIGIADDKDNNYEENFIIEVPNAL